MKLKYYLKNLELGLGKPRNKALVLAPSGRDAIAPHNLALGSKGIESMDWYERLAELYDLFACEQDMGITNANGDRLDEYINIFLNHEAEDKWEWEELADLVFESANEVMLEGKLTSDQFERIKLIVLEHKNKYPNQFDYWVNFSNEIDYPIKKIVNLGLEQK